MKNVAFHTDDDDRHWRYDRFFLNQFKSVISISNKKKKTIPKYQQCGWKSIMLFQPLGNNKTDKIFDLSSLERFDIGVTRRLYDGVSTMAK